jgi:hypothetical protein
MIAREASQRSKAGRRINHCAGLFFTLRKPCGSVAMVPSGVAVVSIDPAAYQALQSLFVGFAFAGLLASAFELFTTKRADFRLLEVGGLAAVASVPVVVFSAPFLILRNTVRGRRIEGRPFVFVMLASMIASLWSMASGRVVLDLLQMLGA